MKKVNNIASKQPLFFIGYLAFFMFLTGASKPVENAKLIVNITDLKNHDGKVEIGLYSDNGTFPTPKKQYRMARVSIQANNAKYTFYNLPTGKYALAIYHDENDDKKCNKNILGIPTEAFCFSRNFRPFLSAPKFKDCSINLNGDRAISVKMVY